MIAERDSEGIAIPMYLVDNLPRFINVGRYLDTENSGSVNEIAFECVPYFGFVIEDK